MKTKHIFTLPLFSGMLLLTHAPLQAQSSTQPAFLNPDLPRSERVADLLKQLSVEEKIGLMMNESAPVERLNIPAYDWWNEALHGVARAGRATVFPQAIAMAATFNDPSHLETFTIISDEARAKYNQALSEGNRNRYYGLTFWTPNINIFRDPRWGRGMETYGEDPFLTSRFGLNAVRGLQGDNPDYYKSHACAKHYAVHSGPEWNRHSYNARVSSRDLWDTYLPAFEVLVKQGGVQEVMCAYNRYEDKPCCGSDKLLIDILRNQWGYGGLVVSDCGAIDDFYRKGHHETHPDAAQASASAVRSGTDLECGSSYQALVEGVRNGVISEEELDVSLSRLLTSRFELGMFDPASRVPWSGIPYSIVDSEPHRKQALRVAQESMTLLKNEKNILPLNKTLRTVAVIGANANDSVMLWANYNGFPSSTVTILEGIRQKLPDTKIIYEKGCELAGKSTDLNRDSLQALRNRVKDAEVIIYVGGLSPRLEGEEMPVDADGFRGGDRTCIELPEVQRSMLKELSTLQKPVVFVLCTGSAIGLEKEEPYYQALLNAWYGGQSAGTAVADVLFGDYNPAGRLPVTFYRSTEQLPDFEDYDMSKRTYRYIQEEPLYPFGYGLSYTTFRYDRANLSKTKLKAGESLQVSVPVTNTGNRPGDEVVQVYLHYKDDPQAANKSLKGYRRISLAPGESQKVQFELTPESFVSFDPQQEAPALRPGRYELLIGKSSRTADLQGYSFEIR